MDQTPMGEPIHQPVHNTSLAEQEQLRKNLKIRFLYQVGSSIPFLTALIILGTWKLFQSGHQSRTLSIVACEALFVGYTFWTHAHFWSLGLLMLTLSVLGGIKANTLGLRGVMILLIVTLMTPIFVVVFVQIAIWLFGY
ncbi:MAG: hypothetical protein LQ352_007806 [Teloschistes flavicans]|nr:MAG: hypothetical protein LQ352_007806 [Teloschistes flavicans]